MKYLDLADRVTEIAADALLAGNYARYKKAMRIVKRCVARASK